MKKMILLIAIVLGTIAFASCSPKQGASTTTQDSTTVVADSVQTDSVN